MTRTVESVFDSGAAATAGSTSPVHNVTESGFSATGISGTGYANVVGEKNSLGPPDPVDAASLVELSLVQGEMGTEESIFSEMTYLEPALFDRFEIAGNGLMDRSSKPYSGDPYLWSGRSWSSLGRHSVLLPGSGSVWL